MSKIFPGTVRDYWVKLVACGRDGSETTLAGGVRSNDIAVRINGSFCFTGPSNRRVWFIDSSGKRRLAHEGLGAPNGILFPPGRSLLCVAGSQNKRVWSFHVQPNGDLASGQPFYRRETSGESPRIVAGGMAVDSECHLCGTASEALQACDPPGRAVAILSKPQPGSLSNAVFGGPNLDTLYVTAGERVFKRKLRRKGVFPWQPVKPPAPRLS
jgi:sugar lactone lactonase YvrE